MFLTASCQKIVPYTFRGREDVVGCIFWGGGGKPWAGELGVDVGAPGMGVVEIVLGVDVAEGVLTGSAAGDELVAPFVGAGGENEVDGETAGPDSAMREAFNQCGRSEALD